MRFQQDKNTIDDKAELPQGRQKITTELTRHRHYGVAHYSFVQPTSVQTAVAEQREYKTPCPAMKRAYRR